MEDEKLKSLFVDFDPEITSDARFMDNLQRNLNAVEIVRRHSAEVKVINKKAVVIAALAGLVVGFLLSLLLPCLGNVIAKWQLSAPEESISALLARNFQLIIWIIAGVCATLVSVNAYELSLSLLKPKESTATP
ncbi:MAG: hypothetical protein K2M80_04230 [Muribaculaceae bacterium]|nr:hypothetical protein [Muribaculaceae bacterium]